MQNGEVKIFEKNGYHIKITKISFIGFELVIDNEKEIISTESELNEILDCL